MSALRTIKSFWKFVLARLCIEVVASVSENPSKKQDLRRLLCTHIHRTPVSCFLVFAVFLFFLTLITSPFHSHPRPTTISLPVRCLATASVAWQRGPPSLETPTSVLLVQNNGHVAFPGIFSHLLLPRR